MAEEDNYIKIDDFSQKVLNQILEPDSLTNANRTQLREQLFNSKGLEVNIGQQHTYKILLDPTKEYWALVRYFRRLSNEQPSKETIKAKICERHHGCPQGGGRRNRNRSMSKQYRKKKSKKTKKKKKRKNKSKKKM